jgi:hypothetical protein
MLQELHAARTACCKSRMLQELHPATAACCNSCMLQQLHAASTKLLHAAAGHLQCDAADDARHWQALVHCRVVGVKLDVPAAASGSNAAGRISRQPLPPQPTHFQQADRTR